MMNNIYPKDSEARRIGSRGRQIVHSIFNVERWEYHEITGNDYGVDACIEYCNNGEFRNEKFDCQIKATGKIKILKNNNISFNSFPVITYNYAKNGRTPFVFLLVDIEMFKVYYFFINNFDVKKENYNSQKTITINIPQNNCINDNEKEFIAKLLQFYEK